MEPETKQESVADTTNETVTPNQSSDTTTNSAPEMSSTGSATAEDENSEFKMFAILGYILPFLFFLPLLNDKSKNVPFARFHANQQLMLLILFFALSLLQGHLMMLLMGLGYLLIQILNLAILGLAIYGAYHAYNGEMKELPLIGKFKILK